MGCVWYVPLVEKIVDKLVSLFQKKHEDGERKKKKKDKKKKKVNS